MGRIRWREGCGLMGRCKCVGGAEEKRGGEAG